MKRIITQMLVCYQYGHKKNLTDAEKANIVFRKANDMQTIHIGNRIKQDH